MQAIDDLLHDALVRLARLDDPVGLAPAQVQIKDPSLEDLFIKLTGRELRD